MRFTPKSEEEIASTNLLAGGDYDFEIAKAEDGVSKAGNEMIALTLHIEGDEGRKHTVFDYLVGSDASMFKVRGFAECVGLLEEYNKGDMPAETLVGRTGRAQVGVDDKNKAYPAKNVVRQYYKPGAQKANGSAAATKSVHPAFDDTIPFAPEWR